MVGLFEARSRAGVRLASLAGLHEALAALAATIRFLAASRRAITRLRAKILATNQPRTMTTRNSACKNIKRLIANN
ncbi:hypothetical protein A1355_03295 [Methylomonas koyamae]|uniref:Uncharacterized protein n=1 Tax=Methylomonas koyamae TaxID=702114 RepID=A0A177NPT4_9GAMM|nr:hypothetical protein A1355_03295 [Methylomonas koyamae]